MRSWSLQILSTLVSGPSSTAFTSIRDTFLLALRYLKDGTQEFRQLSKQRILYRPPPQSSTAWTMAFATRLAVASSWSGNMSFGQPLFVVLFTRRLKKGGSTRSFPRSAFRPCS